MSGSVLAQNRQVIGKVTTVAGAGLPGVSVVIKGTTTGTTTNGDYALTVADEKAALVYSFIGFANQTVVVGNQSTIDVTLTKGAEQLGEVVVTALGIRKEARTIGYTTQEIKGSQLVKAREPNPVNSLVGKIAGLTVAPSDFTASVGADISVPIPALSTAAIDGKFSFTNYLRYYVSLTGPEPYVMVGSTGRRP